MKAKLFFVRLRWSVSDQQRYAGGRSFQGSFLILADDFFFF